MRILPFHQNGVKYLKLKTQDGNAFSTLLETLNKSYQTKSRY